MDNRANYTLVGLTMLILCMALIALILWLSFGWNRTVYQTYLVYMNQAVSGLSPQASVQFNGVEVGSVSDIKLNPDNPQQVILYLKVKQGTPVTESTVATLAAQGITGISYVALSAKTPNAPLLQAQAGQQYPVIPSEPSLFMQLDAFLRGTSNSLQTLLSPENLQNFAKTMQNIQVITNVLAQNAGHIDATLKTAPLALNNFNQLTQQGNVALGTFITLLMRLNNLSGNMDELTNLLKQNPAVLLRGTVQSQPGPGE